MSPDPQHQPAEAERRGTIVSLIRGLEVLQLLNDHERLTFQEVQRLSGLSGGTAYRMLRTLIGLGYIALDPVTRRYCVTSKVMNLSDGFDAERWVESIAWPCMRRLGEAIKWPISLGTLSGAQVLLRATTDRESYLVFGVAKGGTRLPVLTSCAGQMLLAHQSPAEREALLDLVASQGESEAAAARDRAGWARYLDRIRDQGWFVLRRADKRETFISVPIRLSETRILGVLTMRYFSSVMSISSGVEQYQPALAAAAAEIARDYGPWRSRIEGHAD